MVALAILLPLAGVASAAEGRFAWQRDHATVLPHGDLTWAPEPHRYVPGTVVRFIDHAEGDDQRSGASPDQAWKHHPWDPQASGQAAKETADTYVFKGGVLYRGRLAAKQGGRPGAPIRLTRDPAWGAGEALLVGSQVVTGWRQGAGPAASPLRERVWTAEVDWLPRTVWVVTADGEAQRIPLARMPNWRVEGRDDIKAQWWSWSNRGVDHFRSSRKVDGRELNFATDPDRLTADVLARAANAIVWSEYGWVMGTPYPSQIRAIDDKKGGIAFGSQWSDNAASHIVTGCRYYLEDAPGFLDDPQGEHWVERLEGNRARIHLILPEGLTLADVRIEVGRHQEILVADRTSHVEISGLSFRYTNAGWNLDRQGTGTAIQLRGPCANITVAACTFADLGTAVHASIEGEHGAIRGLVLRDNDVLRTDEGGFTVLSADRWGMADGPFAHVEDVHVLRNRLQWIGMRPSREGQGHAINLQVVRTLHCAGNILDMCWAAGIFVYGGKNIESNVDVPLVRILIHQNKVTNALLNSNDWGGIETWQGGPAYVFNNVVGDVRGYWHYNFLGSADPHRNASFGHAYYLDGAFKNYLFNNIAYGRTRDWTSPFQTCSAFQEIHSYQNTFFNNTAYDFSVASRRQAPVAGRNKYLGNIFEGMRQAFRHSDAKGVREANADHAGDQAEHFHHNTNAYARNVFHAVETFGLFEEDGQLRDTLNDFAGALSDRQALASEVGVNLDLSPLPGGGTHDFTPTAAVDGLGAQVFVPWALYACVGEWHFRPSRRDGRIIDEHWYLTEYHAGRTRYHDQPRHPLLPGPGSDAPTVEVSPLEDWLPAAVRLNGSGQYFHIPHTTLTEPITYETNNRGGPLRGQRRTHVAADAARRSPQVWTSNLLIEAYLRVEGDGIVIEKMDAQTGYSLRVRDGRVVFALRHAGQEVAVTASRPLDRSVWHHVLVEADREARQLRLYLDGLTDAQAPGLGPVVLANGADVLVGGGPEGPHLTGSLAYLRLCLGTLADAQTTIEELYAWQFAGPNRRDFSGQPPRGRGRDAGAIEGPVARPASRE